MIWNYSAILVAKILLMAVWGLSFGWQPKILRPFLHKWVVGSFLIALSTAGLILISLGVVGVANLVLIIVANLVQLGLGIVFFVTDLTLHLRDGRGLVVHHVGCRMNGGAREIQV